MQRNPSPWMVVLVALALAGACLQRLDVLQAVNPDGGGGNAVTWTDLDPPATRGFCRLMGTADRSAIFAIAEDGRVFALTSAGWSAALTALPNWGAYDRCGLWVSPSLGVFVGGTTTFQHCAGGCEKPDASWEVGFTSSGSEYIQALCGQGNEVYGVSQ